ncbi:MAG: adenosylcobinamide-GDP ribazoletransferase [Candidatus Limnocylindrales bacterium]
MQDRTTPAATPVATPATRTRPAARRAIARTLDTIRAAVALLTRLSVGSGRGDRTGAAAFPVVGLLVGVLASVPVVVLGRAEPVLAGLLAVAAAAVVTGALHLDGLADTADALLAPDAVRAESARKDPAAGPGGVVALVLVLGVEVAAIDSIVRSSGVGPAVAALVVAATVARAVPVVAVRIVARSPAATVSGFGAWFITRVTSAESLVALVLAGTIVAVAVAVVGLPLIGLAAAVGPIVGLGLARWLIERRGGLDGDALGACVEVSVAAVLVSSAVLLPG